MSLRKGKIVLLAAVFALAASLTGFAQSPCNGPNIIYCQTWDGGSNLAASQNDTTGGFGNFATVYDHFVIVGNTYDVESFHWVGGYFNPPNQGPITAWGLTFYPDMGGIPDINNPMFFIHPLGTGNETFLGNVGGFPIYEYELDFKSFDMAPGTYWASVVPDLGFPPQWGWATSNIGNGAGYQCFFGTCGGTGFSYAFAVDGVVVNNGTPEPSTLIMLGTGILGLAGSLRRKLL
jgi:PEP-CTERM motif